jgi:hypothetical protein
MADRVAAVRRELGPSSPPSSPPARSVSGSSIARADAAEETGRLDLASQLLRTEAGVVKARSGAVLSRGFILKTDHYPSGAALPASTTCKD